MPVAEHLIGRARELESFDHHLAELDGGSSAAMALVGEPGIGKTSLLAELANRADKLGYLVLSGSASELERDQPFWVFVDALDEYLNGVPHERFDLLDDPVRTELTMVFPSLERLTAGGEPAPQQERYRSHRAVRALLELLAESRPLVLVFDDLHWADSASVELLDSLLNRGPAAPVLLALGMRPRQAGERLFGALERGRRKGTMTLLELEPLTREEADELLGETLDATEMYRESGGNPFYLEQLAKAANRSPAAESQRGISLGDVDVPPAVAAALAEELALFSPPARRVLEGAAVVGEPFEPELAAVATGVREPEVLDALDELLGLDVVRPTEVPRRFRFRHPLVRRAVYESTPGGWRLGAHERTAAALAARGAPASTRAHHVELSARQGDLTAISTLRDAGEAAAHRAPASAAPWFEAALRILPATTPAHERIELLLARAGALAAIGHFADSHATLLETMSIAPAEETRLRVRLTTMCATVEHLLGRHQQAHARLEKTLAELADRDSPEAVELMIELAVDRFFRLEYDGMREWAARAVGTAPHVGDQPLTAAALAVAAVAGAFSGAIEEGSAYRDQAAEFIDGLPDEVLARRLDALVHLATAEIDLDRFEAAGRHRERALAIGRATGQGDVFPLISPMLGMAWWIRAE